MTCSRILLKTGEYKELNQMSGYWRYVFSIEKNSFRFHIFPSHFYQRFSFILKFHRNRKLSFWNFIFKWFLNVKPIIKLWKKPCAGMDPSAGIHKIHPQGMKNTERIPNKTTWQQTKLNVECLAFSKKGSWFYSTKWWVI